MRRPNMQFKIPRRKLIQLPAGATALALGARPGPAAVQRGGGLPEPQEAPFDTVVVLMMENRSFDHVLGWLPGANGRQDGLSYVDKDGATHPTWPLGPDFQGCAYED